MHQLITHENMVYVQAMVVIMKRNILLHQISLMVLNVFLVVMMIVVQEDILIVKLYLLNHKHE
jgi:hypothetical protein